jgi:hypothetical protein
LSKENLGLPRRNFGEGGSGGPGPVSMALPTEKAQGTRLKAQRRKEY